MPPFDSSPGSASPVPFASTLRRLLASSPAAPVTSLASFSVLLRATTEGLAAPVDRAIAGGFSADRVAYAFAAGYQAALLALVGDTAAEGPVALCITEQGGAHPRAIATMLRPAEGGGFLVDGQKRWTTLSGDGGGTLLVAASTGAGEDGRNRIKLVRVDANAAGVTMTPMAETPFVPEIPHAEVRFEGVRVAENAVLPGDGYDRYIKPFRTVEDIHVHAAVMGYVFGVARKHSFPPAVRESIAALLAGVRALAFEDPLAPETHVALAGVLGLARRILDDAEPCWATVDPETRARWERDRALLGVASVARAKRLESAYRALGGA
jgi:acyl-CoA dehydrogenase